MGDKSGDGLLKGYIYVMILLTAVAGGAAWWFHSGNERAVAPIVAKLPDVIRSAREAVDYHAPSITAYYDLRSSGAISDVDKSEFERTQELMERLLTQEMGINPANFNTAKIEPRASRDNREPLRHGVKLEKFRATRKQWQDFFSKAKERFGTYVTVQNLSVTANTRVNERTELAGSIDDNNFLYMVEAEFVWYVQQPGSSSASSADGGRIR